MKKWIIRMAALICALSLFPGAKVSAMDAAAARKELEELISCEEKFLFEDGDVVGFFGDSITHVEYTGISYQEFLYNYYITRYPDWALEFRNLGTASYMAADAVRLYSGSGRVVDPAMEGINKAVIMFGMNEALHSWSANRYIQSVAQLVRLLKERGLSSEDIILVTPTPYDQTRSSNYTEEGEQVEDTDDLLCEYTGELKILAEDLGTHYVDLHTPMLWVTELVQKKIADDTLTVRDNVHPNAMGNTLAGYFFLYQQGADREVAAVRISEGIEAGAAHAQVTKLKRKGNRYLRFKYGIDSLPMAVSYEFNQATQYFEVVDAISYEKLQVSGLPAKTQYTVYMNYVPVAVFTGAELEEGVNLANCDRNPGQMAAKEIEVLNQQWHRVSSEYRSVVREATRYGSSVTQEDVNAAYEEWREETAGLREEMYEIARKNVRHTCTVELVSEGYHVWMGQEVWHWAVEGAAAAAALCAGALLVQKKRKKSKGVGK